MDLLKRYRGIGLGNNVWHVVFIRFLNRRRGTDNHDFDPLLLIEVQRR